MSILLSYKALYTRPYNTTLSVITMLQFEIIMIIDYIYILIFCAHYINILSYYLL